MSEALQPVIELRAHEVDAAVRMLTAVLSGEGGHVTEATK